MKSDPSVIDFQVPLGQAHEQLRASEVADKNTVEISVVIPVYNSERSLVPLYERLSAVLANISPDYEIVFIEDCGRDNSWQLLVDLAKKDSHVRSYKLSRNFGQHAAITAGLYYSRGNWTAVMDCDLQDPPESLPELYQKAQEGFDIVLGKRLERKHSFFRRFFADLYAYLLRMFSTPGFTGNYGSYSLLARTVVDAYLKFTDRNRHYLLILLWLGFNRGEVEYLQGERLGGKSSYSLGKLIAHALQGIFFQTTVLLQSIVTLGFVVSFAGLCLAAYVIYSYFMHLALEGWTSLTVLILLLCGTILVCLGIVGLYVGQVFEQVRERPLFVVARSVCADDLGTADASKNNRNPVV